MRMWRTLACLAASMLVATAASAQADIGARLQLIDCPFGRPTGEPTPFLWTSATLEDARVRTRDQVGTTTDPGTGQPAPVWGEFRGTVDTSSTGAPGCITGNALAEVTEASGALTTGLAFVGGGTRVAELHLPESGGEGTASASLLRDFSLDARSSVTFTGAGFLTAMGLDDPLLIDSFAIEGSAPGEASGGWIWLDRDGRAGASFGAVVATDVYDGLFSYEMTPEGWLRFTITNLGDETLFGQFHSTAFVDISLPSLPVPEPQTVWLLGVGLGLLLLRRRRLV